MTPPSAVVCRWTEAFQRGDSESLAELFAEDAGSYLTFPRQRDLRMPTREER